MVAGMSTKSGEPRGGNSTHTSKKTQSQHTKPKAPVEAMQMARILEDSHSPTDLSDKVRQVQAVVPNRSEEEIYIALHDTDYEPEKAISVLLDSDTQSTGGEWTTSGGRKGKKKSGQSDGIDLIVAPGDSKTQSKKKVPSTSKAGMLNTREGYGGGVAVSDRGRGRGSSGRGRSASGPRREQGKKKASVGNSAPGERRGRGNKDKARINKSSLLTQSQPTAQTDEVWDTLPVENDVGGEFRGKEGTTEEWDSWDNPGKSQTFWDVAEDPPPLQDEAAVPDQPVFPEAIPSQQTLQLSTPSEATPTLAIADRDHTHPQLTNIRNSDTQRDDDGRGKGGRKPRRIARSQIPTQPVEMPGEGESLDLQFGSLGIDFGGPDSSPALSTAVVSGYDSILTYSGDHRLSEDPGVISVSNSTTNYRLAEQVAVDTPTTLEGPPGLTHPSSHDRSIESHDQRLASHEKGIESHDRNLESHDRLPLNATPSVEQLSIEALSPTVGKEGPTLTSSLPTSTKNSSILTAPQSISLSSQLNTSTSGSVSVSAASDLLMSHTSAPSSTHVPTPSTNHSGTGVSGKQGAVPPGMLYPHMMPQYPAAFMPMYPPAAAAAANYDPSDMSRYQASVSLAYYQGGAGDPTLSAAGGRDQYSSGGTDKFGRAEVSASVTQPSVGQASQVTGGALAGNQGGMQPAFMNYAYPSNMNMFYPMYFSPAAAAHSMAPKPTSGGTTFPGGATGSFQGNSYSYDNVTSSHDYGKMYSSTGGMGSKSTNLPKSTAGGDMGLSSVYKQPHFDKQATSNYQGFGVQNQQQQYMGYNVMQVPTMPLPHIPVLPGGESAGGSGRGGQKHSSKASAYQSNNSYWSGHSS